MFQAENKKLNVDFNVELFKMKELYKFFKYQTIIEANPFKDEQHILSYIGFYEKIQIAKQTQDWCLLCQYGYPIFILLIKALHFAYFSKETQLSEIQLLVYFDFFGMLKLHHGNIVCVGLTLLEAYFHYFLFFSTKLNLVVNDRKQLFNRNYRKFKFYWPHNYKTQRCGEYLRYNIVKLLKIFQGFVLALGLYLK